MSTLKWLRVICNKLDKSYLALPSVAPKARRDLRQFLRQCDSKEDAFNLLLAVCEAINNSIEHAYWNFTTKPRIVHVRGYLQAERDSARIIIEVEDNGCWNVCKKQLISEHHLDDERGNGLPMMQTLVHGVQIFSKLQGGTIVRFCMPTTKTIPEHYFN